MVSTINWHLLTSGDVSMAGVWGVKVLGQYRSKTF